MITRQCEIRGRENLVCQKFCWDEYAQWIAIEAYNFYLELNTHCEKANITKTVVLLRKITFVVSFTSITLMGDHLSNVKQALSLIHTSNQSHWWTCMIPGRCVYLKAVSIKMHNWLLSWATNTEKSGERAIYTILMEETALVGSVSTSKETGFESFLQTYKVNFFLKIEFEHKIVLFLASFKEPGIIEVHSLILYNL